MKKKFSVSVEKEQLIFSAAHFITIDDKICERIHGHNYRVSCEVFGSLNDQAFVVDFIDLRDELARIVGQLDHHVLLPMQHPAIMVESTDAEVTARFQERRWVFPKADCCLLPMDNTTAERLAEYIGTLLWPTIVARTVGVEEMAVAVDENEGQWGRCRFQK